MSNSDLLTVGISALATGICMPVVIRMLHRLGAVDVPNHRSSHTRVVPRGAGWGPAFGVAVGDAFMRTQGEGLPLPLLAILAAHLVIGFVDDIRTLTVGIRLVTLALMALAAVGWYSGTESGRNIGLVTGLVLVVGLLATVNAFNFMDGINGISGLTALACSVWYLYIGLAQDSTWLIALAAPLLGAAMGFLPWNVPRASVFLGDAGSYLLGAAIAFMAIIAWSAGAGALEALAPLTVYIVDTGGTLVARVIRRQRLTEAHRDHAYQLLVPHVGSHHLASAVVLAFTLASMGSVAFLPNAASAWSVVLLLGVGYFVLPRLIARWL